MRLSFPLQNWLFVLITFAVVAVPGGLVVASFMSYRSTVQATVRAEELSGRIRHLDEVLTMSARMAATTGDARWSVRYDEHVGDLDLAITDFAALANSRALPNITTTTAAANRALVDMEGRALGLAQRGLLSQAYALLTSPEYEAQKRNYGDGLNRAVATVRGSLRRRDRAAPGVLAAHGRARRDGFPHLLYGLVLAGKPLPAQPGLPQQHVARRTRRSQRRQQRQVDCSLRP